MVMASQPTAQKMNYWYAGTENGTSYCAKNNEWACMADRKMNENCSESLVGYGSEF
jgi:frataxin-like iron-binding protein CyaY